LQEENKTLRERIEEIQKKNKLLRESLGVMHQKMDSIIKIQEEKHSRLLQRSIMYAFLKNLKLYLEIEEDEEDNNLNSIQSIYEEMLRKEQGNRATRNLFLKRCGCEMMSFDRSFISKCRGNAFQYAHPKFVHFDCLRGKKRECASKKEEIKEFLQEKMNDEKRLRQAIAILSALEVLVSLRGADDQPLLDH
jgi:hypothetical protein